MHKIKGYHVDVKTQKCRLGIWGSTGRQGLNKREKEERKSQREKESG